MDDFKKAQIKDIGPGGFKCKCCNFFRTSKNRKDSLLNRQARSRLKRQLHHDVSEALSSYSNLSENSSDPFKEY